MNGFSLSWTDAYGFYNEVNGEFDFVMEIGEEDGAFSPTSRGVSLVRISE